MVCQSLLVGNHLPTRLGNVLAVGIVAGIILCHLGHERRRVHHHHYHPCHKKHMKPHMPHHEMRHPDMYGPYAPVGEY